jgi:hypothetical protein
VSRWIIAGVGVLSGGSVLWFLLIQPIAPTAAAGKVGIIGIALVCFSISAVCFPGPLRGPAARLIGMVVFLSYLFHALDMIGSLSFPGVVTKNPGLASLMRCWECASSEFREPT